ncbi:MAG: DUF1461 domain-containing protein [Candidatus Limnocylindrales bacterium]|jgi:hypothetical protein
MAILVALATMVILIAGAVLLSMVPLYLHGALDRAGSAGLLGVSVAEAHALSDATIGELVLGPGTFDVPFRGGSFYDAAEASHLRDARTVLGGLLVVAGGSLIVLAVALARSRRTARTWRAMAAGAGTLVVAFVVIGLAFALAFDAAFTLFHEIFFPAGNWAFDPATQRLVQLYPIPFWQEVTLVLGAVILIAGTSLWWLARRRARRLAIEPTGVGG